MTERMTPEQYRALIRKKRGSGRQRVKGAKRVERDGWRLDSKREAKRYDELVLLKRAGKLRPPYFLRQVPFHLTDGSGETYRADFLVFWADGSMSVEDPKGHVTEVFKSKKKRVEHQFDIEVKLL